MKLHEHTLPQLNLVTGYGAGELRISGQSIVAPCIVAPTSLQPGWIANQSLLDAAALEPVWILQPRVVLLGAAGTNVLGISRDLRNEFGRRNIALEAMDLGAACRTYNVLAQEDRAVVALLFP
jgi:uncharacterized protein